MAIPICSWSVSTCLCRMGVRGALPAFSASFCPAGTAMTAAQVYFNEATGGRYVPRAVLMDLEPGPCVSGVMDGG